MRYRAGQVDASGDCPRSWPNSTGTAAGFASVISRAWSPRWSWTRGASEGVPSGCLASGLDSSTDNGPVQREEEHWRRVLDVNLSGVIYGTMSAYRAMRAQGSGHIINTASVAGLVPSPLAVPYVTAKHAVV
ncbi:MAG: SDR family oxidoreductase, partial [Acidobacteria bacterium]|nr:SDR family oxidoreductase [Acidobacteriota bacterium]